MRFEYIFLINVHNLSGLPNLDNVLLVDGLKANLLSISQLCDKDHFVSFTKESCRVFDKLNQLVLEGKRSKDNCYTISIEKPLGNLTTLDSATLWHQRLGHVNFKTLSNLNSDTILIPETK